MISSKGKPHTVTKKTSTKRDDPRQSRLFIQKAHELGTDEEKSAADELLGRLAKMPRRPRTKKPR
jgi:hypothetical protein